MKISFVGRGRSGKDTAAKWFHKNTTLRFRPGHSCSKILLPHMLASYPGLSEKEVFDTRTTDRKKWYRKGKSLQSDNPLYLVERLLEDCDLIVGIRTIDEMSFSRDLIDLHIWVERIDAPPDPTLEFDSNMCDIVLLNNGTENEFYSRLARLAFAIGIVVELWECQECGYDNLEAKIMVKPRICPMCAGDNGREGSIVSI